MKLPPGHPIRGNELLSAAQASVMQQVLGTHWNSGKMDQAVSQTNE